MPTRARHWCPVCHQSPTTPPWPGHAATRECGGGERPAANLLLIAGIVLLLALAVTSSLH